MDTYITRLCWNENGWERPSGSAAKLEAGPTFNAINGFGFEEWLFSPYFAVDGWRYGFVQGVNKSVKRLGGETIRILFFTIRPDHKRFFVGELQSCLVLTQAQADDAHRELERDGVIDRMVAEIAAVNGRDEMIRDKSYIQKWTLDVINVRFRANDLRKYASLREVAADSSVHRLQRYQLVKAKDEEVERWFREPEQIDGPSLPEEIRPGALYREGSVAQILVNRYERDPKARAACIAHYGTSCSICGFDFVQAYGESTRGLIHVHHVIPLHEVGADYCINPIRDLRPVCPNCHAVLHWKDSFSIEDVERMLRNNV